MVFAERVGSKFTKIKSRIQLGIEILSGSLIQPKTSLFMSAYCHLQ